MPEEGTYGDVQPMGKAGDTLGEELEMAELAFSIAETHFEEVDSPV